MGSWRNLGDPVNVQRESGSWERRRSVSVGISVIPEKKLFGLVPGRPPSSVWTQFGAESEDISCKICARSHADPSVRRFRFLLLPSSGVSATLWLGSPLSFPWSTSSSWSRRP